MQENSDIILSLFDCENFFTEEFSERFFSLLPKEDANGDVLSRCGRLLLRYMLVKNAFFTKEEALSLSFDKGKFGKPYISGKNIEFSISHSGRLVGCAIGSDCVGFDLQERKLEKEKAEKLAKRFFSEWEQKALAESDDTEKMFHLIWTKKEALVKYHGVNFENSPLCDSSAIPRELCFFSGFMSQEKEGYAFSLCCKRGSAVAQPRFVMPGEILATLGGNN
jgi:hypothetical protein